LSSATVDITEALVVRVGLVDIVDDYFSTLVYLTVYGLAITLV
jgi:hypothetical protein